MRQFITNVANVLWRLVLIADILFACGQQHRSTGVWREAVSRAVSVALLQVRSQICLHRPL
jgi:hypothetical protein